MNLKLFFPQFSSILLAKIERLSPDEVITAAKACLLLVAIRNGRLVTQGDEKKHLKNYPTMGDNRA